jgi:hypothetical protein
MIWLGIIDLEKLIQFISFDEQIKLETHQLQIQIDFKKIEQNNIDR